MGGTVGRARDGCVCGGGITRVPTRMGDAPSIRADSCAAWQARHAPARAPAGGQNLLKPSTILHYPSHVPLVKLVRIPTSETLIER